MRSLPLIRWISLCLVLLAACAPEADQPPELESAAVEAAVPTAGAASPAPDVGVERPVVVFLGTSLTAGLGLARAEDGYVARVAALADSAGLPFRAVNAGVSGETSAGGLRRLDWLLRDSLDVLVLELGANDGLRGLDPGAMARNLETIIRRTRSRYPGSSVVIAGMEAPTNLGAEYTQRFRQVFGRLAGEQDAVLVPFLLEGVAGVPELNQDDGIHPTAQGHDRMAKTLWPYLEPLLARKHEAHGGAR